MEFQYTKKLGYGRNSRFDPLVSVKVIGDEEFDAYCLVDSDSQCNLFSIDVAKAAGVDLLGARKVDASVGGIQ